MTTVPSPAPPLTCDDLRRLQPSLQAYLARFLPLFPRRDQGASFLAYAEGLLSGERRKSVERMVLRELDGDMNQVRRLQYFAADSPWSDQPFLEGHWQAVGAALGTREGVFLVDTTDMPKQGVHSVGVARQYCGRLGQVANCQAGVFVAYTGQGGTTLVHRRLFLTEAWVGDEAYAARRQRCGVPEDATFRTQPQLALGMLTELVADGSLPARWVSCDEGYGRSGDFLDGVAALGLGYMAEVPVDTRLWPERPPTVVPRTRPRLAPGAPAALEARTLAAQLPAEAWTRRRVREGSRGPEYADFAIRRVVASREGLPGPDVWLVLRRRPGSDGLKVFLCHAPGRIRPARLARLTSTRWAIETCFQEGKQLLGLGDYEGRSWQGWHRHTTLCLLLHFFLRQGQLGLKKNSPA
jgi:SRSO17 transposase